MKTISEAIPEIAAQLARQPAKPVGTIAFKIFSDHLFDPSGNGGVIFEGSSGAHVFRVVRERKPELTYYYWSPGTGSRVATVDLTQTSAAQGVQIAFNWHPKKTQLCVIPLLASGAKELIAEGVSTSKSFRKDKRGQIIQIGDSGVQLMDIRIEVDGAPIMLPTAHENWQATEEACEILQRGKSDDGYLFEVVRNNSVLTKLVTGFETYCKNRMVELEQEGVFPDLTKLSTILAYGSDDKATLVEASCQTADDMGISTLELWLNKQRRVNFQEFEKAKRAFNKAYGLKFGNLGLRGDEIEKLKALFAHRHRVVHVSPIAQLLLGNDPAMGKQLLAEAPSRFTNFIERLHEATLALGMTDAQNSLPNK